MLWRGLLLGLSELCGKSDKQRGRHYGDGAYIQVPYHAMWGGHHIHLGRNVYINFNCTLVDDAQITIGDGR